MIWGPAEALRRIILEFFRDMDNFYRYGSDTGQTESNANQLGV